MCAILSVCTGALRRFQLILPTNKSVKAEALVTLPSPLWSAQSLFLPNDTSPKPAMHAKDCIIFPSPGHDYSLHMRLHVDTSMCYRHTGIMCMSMCLCMYSESVGACASAYVHMCMYCTCAYIAYSLAKGNSNTMRLCKSQNQMVQEA